MLPPFRPLLALCLGCGLPAQSVDDLNSLVLQAHRYADHAASAPRPDPGLELFRIVGDNGGTGAELMQKGADIQRWTLIFRVSPPIQPSDRKNGPQPPTQSVSVVCAQGLFQDATWSSLPVFDCKCLEWAWFTISLDGAVTQLRNQGFTRGFSSLTLMRPLYYRYPDECTYVFKCPPDHAYVGISAQTGRTLWTEPFGEGSIMHP